MRDEESDTSDIGKRRILLCAWPAEGFREVMLFEMLLPLLPFRFVTILASDDQFRTLLGILCQTAHALQSSFCNVFLGDLFAPKSGSLEVFEANIDGFVFRWCAISTPALERRLKSSDRTDRGASVKIGFGCVRA